MQENKRISSLYGVWYKLLISVFGFDFAISLGIILILKSSLKSILPPQFNITKYLIASQIFGLIYLGYLIFNMKFDIHCRLYVLYLL